MALLLVAHLADALKQRNIDVADSEPYWLEPEQYHERDGGVEFLPGMAGDLMAYIGTNNLRPLGVVIVEEMATITST